MNEKIYMVPNPPTPNKGMKFNPDICTGCNLCVDVCPDDVFMPNPEKKKTPIVLYPEECWFCGGCVEECPRPGAISISHPTSQNISVNWKSKDTGELFRLHQKDPPPANNRPPSGGG
jgi:NAD-dependent dihydropyrimidine dehydrogenase PreA subunit